MDAHDDIAMPEATVGPSPANPGGAPSATVGRSRAARDDAASGSPEPPGAADPVPDLLAELYIEVRRIARRGLRGERRNHTLQTTEVAHEAILRLEQVAGAPGMTETHFLAVAARTVRRVLVDHARRRAAVRRGGAGTRRDDAAATDGAVAGTTASRRVPLDASMLRLDAPAVEVLDLHRALEELDRLAPRSAVVVELRFFGGMSEDAVADELEVSRATVARDWRWARAWLRRRLAGAGARDAS